MRVNCLTLYPVLSALYLCCVDPRRRSLVERDALWVMGLILCGLLGVVELMRPCFPAIWPFTEQRLGRGRHFCTHEFFLNRIWLSHQYSAVVWYS